MINTLLTQHRVNQPKPVDGLKYSAIAVCIGLLAACQPAPESDRTTPTAQTPEVSVQQNNTTAGARSQQRQGKPVVYQVFTRLFGNTNDTNKPWGTLEENGVGKFNHFTDTALQGIRELGVTHVWYTGVLHHGLVNDYSEFGISHDDPDVIKGRAGSPYAVKDYYSVSPDLAENPANRMEEFRQLIQRTHQQGMQVVIDIVPNHVARGYQSLGKPDGVEDFGAQDNTQVEYHKNNNFYYVPGKDFVVPQAKEGYQVLGGLSHPRADGKFAESPAKWTGNGSREPQPDQNDWYETVRLNYGVKPDGSYDFDSLEEGFRGKSYTEHQAFWATQTVPDTWVKMRDIALFWLEQGVDGFRYDVAELVPVEFWSYLNSSIKSVKPDSFLLAEVYNPDLYRDYVQLGKMDYLYDKVGLYDDLKLVMQGKAKTDLLVKGQAQLADIEQNMLHFLENHDEQRVASPEFAGDANKGKPAMVVSALNNSGPVMLYFAQDVGEDGSEETGFGDPSRTTIFDYAGVPAHQQWMNQGKFDGGLLTPEQKALREFYQRLMAIAAQHPAVMGEYQDLHQLNRTVSQGYTGELYSFARWSQGQGLVVVSNFSEQQQTLKLNLPKTLLDKMAPARQTDQLQDLLNKGSYTLNVGEQYGMVELTLLPLQSVVLEVK